MKEKLQLLLKVNEINANALVLADRKLIGYWSYQSYIHITLSNPDVQRSLLLRDFYIRASCEIQLKL